MWLFDTQIFLFRTSTLFILLAFFAIFTVITRGKSLLRRMFTAGVLTVFVSLSMELSWEIASGIRWSILTPLPKWTALQGQPVMFLFYFVFALLLIPFVVISVRNGDIARKEVWIPLATVFCYYIVANLLSPSIYFNDYGYLVRHSGEVFTYAQKLLFLIPEYFIPRGLFIGALLVTHRGVTSIFQKRRD